MVNYSGIIAGATMFIFTGIFHPVIIKCEYYFSAKIWPVFLVLGLACVGLSLCSENNIISDVSGILGFVLLWSIRELKQQEKRVAKGWFPGNPKRV